MVPPATMDEIAAKVKAALTSTPYSCDELIPLAGGNANYVFRGHLSNPLPPDNTHQVLIKHGEPFVRTNESFSLPLTRCNVENVALHEIQTSPKATSPSPPWCTVRTPKQHHFDRETHTQVQEYLPTGIDLKNYALKYYEPHTNPSKKPQCLALGHSLGIWLKTFHDWTAVWAAKERFPSTARSRPSIHTIAFQNKILQMLKHKTYYDSLLKLVDTFPAILPQARQVFEQVKSMADQELADDSTLQAVHGDFWTGNILIPDKEMDCEAPPEPTTVFVVDWEVISLGVPVRDVGQMIAELYMLKLFKDIDAGEWIIEGFVEGYGPLGGEDKVFRTLVHIGCHLVVVGGTVDGWGERGDVEGVVGFGRDMIVKGWEGNRKWFEGRVLGGLFGGGRGE
ncbi:kinase-like domain-containing protein [Apodospora peruviana]|uniref:Kinase-like domain-containing protein n=1 Tax=Apodospora peruviana TaxID=516989 RepID=A0AAE0ICR2_9PEZI|nr:kinase-like domain-containing protein [Apodospora peruviana]